MDLNPGAHGAPESTWTAPRPDCPHPEDWHAADAQATEDEVTELVAAMVRALQPEVCVETGTYNGHTAWAMGLALRRNGHGVLYTLEVDPERCALATASLWGVHTVKTVCTSSATWAPPDPIDFGWIDCDTWRRADVLRAWINGRHVHDRTIVGIHDTGPQHPVRELLQPLVDEGLLSLLDLPTPRGVSFARILRR